MLVTKHRGNQGCPKPQKINGDCRTKDEAPNRVHEGALSGQAENSERLALQFRPPWPVGALLTGISVKKRSSLCGILTRWFKRRTWRDSELLERGCESARRGMDYAKSDDNSGHNFDADGVSGRAKAPSVEPSKVPAGAQEATVSPESTPTWLAAATAEMTVTSTPLPTVTTLTPTPLPTVAPLTPTPLPTVAPLTPTPPPTVSTLTPTPPPTVAPLTPTPPPTVAPLAPTPLPTVAPLTPTPLPIVAPLTPTPVLPRQIDMIRNSSPWMYLADVQILERDQPELSVAILSLPWVMDGISEDEEDSVQVLVLTASEAPDVLRAVIQSPWVRDGLGEGEHDVVNILLQIANEDRAVARWLVGLPFMERLTPESAKGAANLARLAIFGREFAESVYGKWWIADGLDRREVAMTKDLVLIAEKDQDKALQMLHMPFLATIETSDILAMHSLARLTPERFHTLMSHWIPNEGITDDWAKRLVVLYEHPAALDQLLNPHFRVVSERLITLPLTGETTIAVINMSATPSRNVLNMMESAVRHHESFMRSPFPIDYIMLVIGGPEFGAGAYFKGTHAFLQLEQQVSVFHVAHELAHYYWSHGGSSWVNEGAAGLLAFRHSQLDHLNAPCPGFRAIADMEKTLGEAAGPVYCAYALGTRLFADLERTLGEDGFRQGFRNLYRAQEAEGYWGIDQAVAAFEAVEGVRGGIVAQVFGRWYYGTHPYVGTELDLRPADGRIASIGGRITEAYVSETEGGSPASNISADNQRTIQDAITVWLTLVLADDVVRDRKADIEIVQYFEDGFAYHAESASFTVESGRASAAVALPITVPTSPGEHGIYVYDEDRKVAQVEYEITR